MECARCGTQGSDLARFCTKCGAPAPGIPFRCAACLAPLGQNARFCATCGTPAPQVAQFDSVPAAPEASASATITSATSSGSPRRGKRIAAFVVAIVVANVAAAAGVYVVEAPARTARTQFDTLLRLSQEPVIVDLEHMLAWQRSLNQALTVIESDPKVLRAFKKLLAGDRTVRSRALGEMTLVATLRAVGDDQLAEFRRETALTKSLTAWKEFLEAVRDPQGWLAGKLNKRVEDLVYRQDAQQAAAADTNWKDGKNPTIEPKFIKLSNLFPRHGDCPAGYAEDTTSGNCVVDFNGAWSGRWAGTISIEGHSCPTGGAITIRLRQTGTQVNGTLEMDDPQVNMETCSTESNSPYSTGLTGAITGNSLRMGSLVMTKASPNSADGSITGPRGTARFFLGRAA